MQTVFPLRTVGLVVLAMTLIVSSDAAAKILSANGFSQIFVAWTRFALAALIVLPVVGLRSTELGSLLRPQIVLRAALIAGGITCILTALKTEPMANVFGGFFIGPIITYFLSAVVLGEKITPLRTALLGFSFLGVLIVVRPGFGMTAGMGFAVLAGCLHGGYLVATRGLAGSYRPLFLLLSQLIIGAFMLAPFAFRSLPVPNVTPNTSLLLLWSALGSAMGNLVLVIISRTTPAGVIAPLIYCQLLVAMILGLVVFNDFPDALGVLGLCIIAGAGISSVWFAGKGR